MKTLKINLSQRFGSFLRDFYYSLLLSVIFQILLFFFASLAQAQVKEPADVLWPDGRKMALSISFDDARVVQLTSAVPLLNQYQIKGTFFLTVNNMEKDVEAWKIVAKQGHEIGNHTMTHPCSAKLLGLRGDGKNLEYMSLDQIEKEIVQANEEIERQIGVKPETYAYPCGETFVGEGSTTQSYVPIIAKHFIVGRGFMDEGPVNPSYPNLSQLNGINLGDDMTFEQLLPLIRNAKDRGSWLVLVAHDVGMGGHLNVPIETLRKLFEYVNDPKNKVWTAPIGEVAHYVKDHNVK